MSDKCDKQVLAVDAGGTVCRMALASSGVPVVVEGGASNATTDFEGAVKQVQDCLSRLAEESGVSQDALTMLPTYVGMAGVTGPEIAKRMANALPFENVRVEEDRAAALCGALGNQDGALAHCGTGSFFGVRLGGKARFCGGWGPILGDEASGYWLGRKALSLAVRSTDGMEGESGLARAILAEFGDATGVVGFAGLASQAEIATLAKQVTAFAADGDAAARRLLQEGADHVSQMLRALGWTPDLTLCLTGGVAPHYHAYLPQEMKAVVRQPVGSPLDGAIALAHELARESA